MSEHPQGDKPGEAFLKALTPPELFSLLDAAGYDTSVTHHNCYRRFSYLKFVQLVVDEYARRFVPSAVAQIAAHDFQPDGGVLRFESHPGGEAPHVHTTCSKCDGVAWFTEFQWELLTKGCARGIRSATPDTVEAKAKRWQQIADQRAIEVADLRRERDQQTNLQVQGQRAGRRQREGCGEVPRAA